MSQPIEQYVTGRYAGDTEFNVDYSLDSPSGRYYPLGSDQYNGPVLIYAQGEWGAYILIHGAVDDAFYTGDPPDIVTYYGVVGYQWDVAKASDPAVQFFVTGAAPTPRRFVTSCLF